METKCLIWNAPNANIAHPIKKKRTAQQINHSGGIVVHAQKVRPRDTKRGKMMSYELVATSVTSGLVIRLGEIFPDIARYRETIPAQMLVYPHWFVNQLTIDTQTERRNHYFVNYFATARYHIAADPSSVVGSLQQQLDAASIKILSELDYIYFDNKPVRITQPRTEKIDGVLHWFGNISVMATKPVKPDPIQEQLKTTITIPLR